ncbi:MAG: response regulator transcription factor [Bacteroidales bacterium]
MRVAKLRSILLADPSEVILQGLAVVVRQAGWGEPHLCRRWDDVFRISDPQQILLGVIGSGMLGEWSCHRSRLMRNFENAIWTAFLYAPFFQEEDPYLRKIFRITDSYEQILTGLKNLAKDETSDDLAMQPLTEREIEVLRLLVQGLSQKEIAQQLHLSVHTIITHRKNITLKTGIKSIAGLTLFALSHKFITP